MAEEPVIDFGDLSTDENFTSTLTSFHNHVDKVGNFLQSACGSGVYDQLSTEDKVQYDLFMAYSVNSLFWLYLRTQGLDPAKHDVKSEIDRVRTYAARAKQVHERKQMKHVDVEAANRFVRNGLWQPKQKEKEKEAKDGEDS